MDVELTGSGAEVNARLFGLRREPATLVIDHPRYNHRAALTDSAPRALAQDLS
jgi:hypothetical protein